jgi:hypothetical protein
MCRLNLEEYLFTQLLYICLDGLQRDGATKARSCQIQKVANHALHPLSAVEDTGGYSRLALVLGR